jgi:hypothetical protein
MPTSRPRRISPRSRSGSLPIRLSSRRVAHEAA